MKTFRLYCDTSVFGGCFDREFAADSNRLFEAVRKKQLKLLLGALVVLELKDAPLEVRRLLLSLPPEQVENVEFTPQARELQEAYLRAGILTPRAAVDAGHVATATVCRADAIVSWNFKHIVQLEKMKLYNEVNLKNGYGFLEIVTPTEVMGNEA